MSRRWLLALLSLVGCAGGGGSEEPSADSSVALDSSIESAVDEGVDTSVADAADAKEETFDVAPDAPSEDPIKESLVGADVPSPRVGMFYLVWHAPAATAMRTVASKGGAQLTIENVIRSNGFSLLSDVLQKWGLEGDAMSFYYQTKPKLGFYCIYRARTGETGVVPDCPDIETTLETHAKQLIAAGVDHVVIDATNLSGTDPASDVLQLRPTEVLFEEWAKLRAKGQKTPQIAVWNAIPKGATQWQKLLALYENPAYDGLVLRDKGTGKKVFFVVDPPDAGRFPDPTALATIGSKDRIVQRMWTIDKSDASVDRWAFMSWCHNAGKVTTSIVGAPACDQPWTPKSSIGSAIAVAPSFQTGYGSLPFDAAGKLDGLTFRRQWATAFAKRPDWVFISGWNEFIAQPQPNPFTSDPYAKSVGLERDPTGNRLFVDTFGADLGRDIEPTEDFGSFYYDLTKSCVRVFKKGATGCSDAAEACCSTEEAWVNVFVLHHPTANDTLLTTSAGEKSSLKAGGWREVCSRYGTSTVFCHDGSDPLTPAAPFLAYASPGAGRKAVYRCLTGTAHFYTLDSGCEGQKVESVLAYFAENPTGATPRRASRCYRASTGEHFMAIGAGCPAGTNDEGILGYVH